MRVEASSERLVLFPLEAPDVAGNGPCVQALLVVVSSMHVTARGRELAGTKVEQE